jgi:DNA-binding CsgD family transcriptional regulator
VPFLVHALISALREVARATVRGLSGRRSMFEHYHEALRLAQDPVLRGRVSRGLAMALILTDQADAADAVVEQALAALGDRSPELAISLERLRAGAAAYDPRLVDEFDRRLPMLRDLVAPGGPAIGSLSLLLAVVGAWRGDDKREVMQLVERGWDGAGVIAGAGDDLTVIQGIGALGLVDELERAGVLTAQLLEGAHARGSLHGYLAGTTYRCWPEARSGRLEAAESELRAALGPIREHTLTFGLPSLLWFAADVLVERPTAADLAALVEETRLGPLAETASGALLLELRGRLRAAAGRRADAIVDLRHAGRIHDALRFRNPNGSAWRSILAATLDPSQRDDALRLAHDGLDDANRTGQRRAIGVAHRTLGLLESGDRRREHLQHAVATLDGSAARLEHARALVDLGAARRRDGKPKEAREPLRAGLDVAVACDATRLIARARSELTASGARVRRMRTTGRDALTASELRVAQLAADGRTNSEIAQGLFIATKTVDTHLSHVYAKLAISSRRELPAALDPNPEQQSK